MGEELIYIIAGVFVIAILGWLIFLTVKYQKIMKKAKIIFENEDPKKLSKMIEDYFDGIEQVNKNHKKLENVLKKTKEVAETGLYKVVLLRYNPFGDIGSNQSFSLCLLNKKNDGFVISSIHSREGTRVYSKPVKGGESTYNLSEEEQKSIKLAIKKGE